MTIHGSSVLRKRCASNHEWTHHQTAGADGIRWVKVCVNCGLQRKNDAEIAADAARSGGVVEERHDG